MRSLPYYVQRIMKCSSCVLIWKEACRKEEKKASGENFKYVNEWVHLTRMLNGLWVNFDNTAARIGISDKSFDRLPENRKSLF